MRWILFILWLAVTPHVGAQTVTPVVSGDLRFRAAEAKEDLDDQRNYQQLRARLSIKATLNEDTMALVRLASGTSPISHNQKLGDPKEPGMTRRFFGIDLAYADWTFAPGAHVSLGRVANPFFTPGKNQLVLSSNLAHEGMALRYDLKGDSVGFFAGGLASMISENYVAATTGIPGEDLADEGLLALQAGVSAKFGETVLTWHLTSYDFQNVQNQSIKTVDAGAAIDPRSNPYFRSNGNTVYPDDPIVPTVYYFTNRYPLLSTGLEIKIPLETFEFVTFYDFVRNLDAKEQREGTEMGVSMKSGRLSASIASIEKQADATMAAFTDSDTNGGGTDNKGTRVTLGYQFTKATFFNLTMYNAKRGVSSVPRDFAMTHAELNLIF